jgi:hypothetical protein
MKTIRRRLVLVAGGVTALALSSTLVAGTTFGFFSSRPGAETNSFASGTVTLSSTVTGACTVTNMAPGDSSSCTLGTTYSGSLSAYVAVDVLIETQGGSGGTALYNPGGSNGLTVAITDNQGSPVTYVVPTTSEAAGVGNCPSSGGWTCYELDNELLGTAAFASGSTDTITTAVALPTAAGNGYQGGQANVILTAHAVQSKNNTISCTTTATAGHSCTPSGSFAWS